MTIITNKTKKATAYLHHNIILVPGTFEVLGVILGSCIFGQKGNIKGRYFNNKFYTSAGEIFAIENGSFNDTTVNLFSVMEDSWRIITIIKDHTCPWVTPTETWINEGIAEYLNR